jgi:hypothetical protein
MLIPILQTSMVFAVQSILPLPITGHFPSSGPDGRSSACRAATNPISPLGATSKARRSRRSPWLCCSAKYASASSGWNATNGDHPGSGRPRWRVPAELRPEEAAQLHFVATVERIQER